MKNSLLKLALEEAGLTEPEVLEPVDTPELEELVEQQAAEDGEVAEKAAELDAVEEVQEGLEALVSSMEAALADPHYSPREYQLQVSHAATLLGRVGLGLPAGLSCESTDGASDAKDSFADKAKKLGKVAAEYAKKFLAWLKDVIVGGLDRCKAVFGKVGALQKAKGCKAGVEYEVDGVWDGYKFDPKNPTKGTEEALKFFKKYVTACLDSARKENTITTDYVLVLEDAFNDPQIPFGLELGGDNGTEIVYSAGVKYKGVTTTTAVNVAAGNATFNNVEKLVYEFEKKLQKVNNQLLFKDGKKICEWLRKVYTAETKVVTAYAQAGARAEEPAK